MRIENLREHAEQINDAQANADILLETARYEYEQASHALAAASSASQSAGSPQDRQRALRMEAMAQAGLEAAEARVRAAEATIREINAERSSAQRETQRYLDQTQEAYRRANAAAGVGPYGNDALTEASNGLLQSLIQGQQVMDLLGGTSNIIGFGGLPSVASGGISLSTLKGAAIMAGDSATESDSGPHKVYVRGGVRHYYSEDEQDPPNEEPIISTIHADIAESVPYVAADTGGLVTTPATNARITQSEDSAPEGGMNAFAHHDIVAAWNHIRSTYAPSSIEYQECAWRALEETEDYHKELSIRHTNALEQLSAATRELVRFDELARIGDYGQTSNKQREELETAYALAKEKAHAISVELNNAKSHLTELRNIASPDQRTSFVAFGGASFKHAYDRFVTEQQGRALEEFGGHCGINEACNIINQQRGYSIGPAEAIKSARGHKDENGNPKPLCQYRHDADDPGRYYDSNGSTSWDERREFLQSYGIQAKRITKDIIGRTKGMTPDDIYSYLLEGNSVGLTIKAQDLGQEGLSQRTALEKDGQGYFHSPVHANHCVSVAGVSLDAKGRVSCIWLNDTSGVVKGCNRIPISVKKYWKMLRYTKRFGVEIGRWEGNSGH